jgi:hypothetical protein
MTIEVAHALVRQVRAGHVDLADAFGALTDLVSVGIELIPASRWPRRPRRSGSSSV